MTEQSLNEFLQIACKAADNQYARGNKQNGDYILSNASVIANRIIRAYKFNKKVMCGNCFKCSYDPIERDFIREWGFCMVCDRQYNEKIEKMMEMEVN